MGRKSREKIERRADRAREAEAARVALAQRREERRRGAEEGRERGCLFCRRTDGGFTSEEHIFPESLGNTEHVLPVGVVCDRCNHTVLSGLDDALCSFAPIEMMRTIYGVPSKRGKPPVFKFDNGELRHPTPGNVFLDLDSAKFHEDAPAPPGMKAWRFSAVRHDMTPKRVAKVHRALVKIAVEFAWSDLGADRVLSSEFDLPRSVVLKGGQSGYLVMMKKANPANEIGFTYDANQRRVSDGRPLIAMLASFFGLPLFTSTLFQKPAHEPPDELGVVYTF